MTELIISGIKCDHCYYRDDDVQFSEYPEFINKPCPLCKHSLLTQKDYNECLSQYRLVARINKIGNILRWINPFYYWRLVFGDKRTTVHLTIEFPNKKKRE